MQIQLHKLAQPEELVQALVARSLVYGDGADYASLISPCSVTLTPTEVQDVTKDIVQLAELYETANTFYLASLNGDLPDWIRASAEHGLTPNEVEAHRLTAHERLVPVTARADYVQVSPARRQLAEIQWKSGGPGLLLGHQSVFTDIFEPHDGAVVLGDLEAKYLEALFAASPGTPAVVVNEVRAEWLNGEATLVRLAEERGCRYVPMSRARLRQTLLWGPHGLQINESGGWHYVTVLRGRGFTEVLDDVFTLKLAKATLGHVLWVEAPINFLYRQKWCLALPFVRDYAAHFPDRLRSFVIPSVLVQTSEMALECIAEQMPDGQADLLASVRRLDELPALPGSLRQRLVLKSGAGVGEFQSRGRGVFRLGGSSRSAAKIIEFVEGRIAASEPWILQPFVDDKYSVPLGLPTVPGESTTVEAHSRLMVFGGYMQHHGWDVHGAIGNFSHHWKVSGSHARTGSRGEMLGSTFVDVRLDTRGERV